MATRKKSISQSIKPAAKGVDTVAGDTQLHEGATFPPTRVEDVFGCLKYKGKPKTIDEMNAAIAAEVRRRHRRGEY